LERGAGSGAAGDVPELEAADVSDRLRTPQFERWFKGSKVVDADGNPLRVYHGTTADFSRFDPNESGTNTGHSTANLGFWFSADTGIANMFAGEIPDETTWPRKFTHKAGANLMPVYLKIKNPYVMSAVEFIDMVNGLGDWAYLQDYDADGRAEEMERIQQRYIKQGYDGVHIVGDKLLSERYGADEYEADAWVAFRPNQIKSTANRGTFDPDSEHVLEASVINELLADVRGAVGGAASTLRQPGKWQLKDRIRSLWTGATPAMLGAVYLNYMPDLSPKSVKAFVERYIDQKRAMDTMRNVLHHAADNIVQDWRRYGRAGKDKMQALASLMHDATKAGVDPDDLNDMLEPDYAALKTRFDAMPDAGRDLYRKVRDAYKEQSQAMDQLLLDNVTKAQEIARRAAERERARKEAEIQADPRKTAAEKTAEITRLNAAAAAAEARGHWSARFRVNRLRSMLETRKVKAPYFPLGRFGSYYVAIRDDTGKLVYFGMAESAFQAKQMKAAARTHLQAGDTIKSGKMPSKLNHMTEVIKPTFIAEIEAMLDGIPNANDPGMRAIRDNILDQIWQRHLQSMPDLSVRSRAIHRSMVAGHSDDALRVFANHMFHAAHQMAKLKHAPDMQDTIDEMGLAAKDAPEAEQIQATNIFDEMVQRNNWVMNPTGKAWAQWAATSAFGYYLGASPAAAAVNLAQTPMVGIPIMAGRFGSMSKAASAVARASRNAISNRGMSATEERALNDMVDAGVIDNTQSYDIQGVGEQGAGYNPIRTRVMGALTIMFHKAEVINRRVTGLAAYRLAIEAGENHATAVKTASNIVWKTHFDYANSSRPRHLTTPGMKTIMAMRSYQINMLYRLGRDLYVSFLKPIKGLTGADLVEAKQLRREARYQLAGILGMQALVAGGTAVAGYNTAFFLYGIASTIMATIFGGGDEGDDPFTAQENFEAAIKDIFGPVLSNVLLHGPIGTLTGVDLTSRVGMPDLWFRSPNQDIETGKDMYSYMLSQWVGAPAGIIDQVMRGYDLFAEGNAWRGTETILPKAAKDVLKSYRYLTEGVTTKTGETIISQDDTGWWSVIAQATGFTPAHIAEKWDETSRLKGAEQRIKVTRQAYINGYAMAVKLGDDAGRRDAIAKIREWNKSTYGRTMPIRSTSIASSLRHSAVAAGKRERGDGILIQNEALRRALQAEPVD
jgi:uncharacterized membrane-anchored protein YhcB (DUF1043 family)